MIKADCNLPASVYKHSNMTRKSVHIADFETGLEAMKFCSEKNRDKYFHDNYIWFPIREGAN